MINITAQFSDKKVAQIIIKHINKKTSEIINWYCSLNKPSKYLPNGYSDEASEKIIQSLKEIIEDEKINELKDHKMQFALSCILEEEERVIDEMLELSATFSHTDHIELEKVLCDKDIRYFENYDNFRDLLLSDNAYLDILEK